VPDVAAEQWQSLRPRIDTICNEAVREQGRRLRRGSRRSSEGGPVWMLPGGRRDEALDTLVYALAARAALPYHLDVAPPKPRPPAPAPLTCGVACKSTEKLRNSVP